ncbi:hypothetical protein [Novosphingobium sp. LASN5T]|uniref:hypothetical protein n=1 Tax=Novosphingobium sp. LASN5T TaxID=2491021 RepID=UPI000F5E73DD|nr:hypothetical protein [Novosphingobium sp. LASN5T]RQW40598.1 hypothetical protein EH199_20605 [Novosphingobium sp. LASN5T]
MHPDVIEFRDRLFSYASAQAIPLPALRDELLTLHHSIDNEESRIELMRLFNVIADLLEAYLVRNGEDLEAFRLHRRGQIWQFLREESLVEGRVDRATLLSVTEREVAAGRLSEADEIRRYALGDDHAFDGYLRIH